MMGKAFHVCFYLGFPDCMDMSDEVHNFNWINCVGYPATSLCDDKKCPADGWSCGDGECILYVSRVIYEPLPFRVGICFNGRQVNHMCELSFDFSLWTKSDGRCAARGYNDISLVLSSNEDICRYLIRCALSMGAEIKCPCNGRNCAVLMGRVCIANLSYAYPLKGVIRPWLMQYFSWEQTWYNKVPTVIYLEGSLRCRGYAIVFTVQNRITVPPNDKKVNTLEKHVCHIASIQNRNYTSSHQYPLSCWNSSFTFNGRPYAFFDICPESKSCFSQYRIADGWKDCMDNEDETKYMSQNISYCQNIRKHRFQCSPEQRTCLPVSQLTPSTQSSGTCFNTYDQQINGRGQYIADIQCYTNLGGNECALIRYYIGNSSTPNSTFSYVDDEDTSTLRLSRKVELQKYCDTFWNVPLSHVDENRDFCQVWICHESQFKCQSGQCIPIDWVCDGEWDCSDASDEFGLLDKWAGHNEHLSKYLNDRKKICQEKYKALPFRDFCNFTHEYPCYRASVPNPLDIFAYRPCINITQIGDGFVDCYGNLDEKNTLEDCKGQMLGYTLRCEQGCLNYFIKCQTDKECAASLLCSYKSKNSSWCSGNQDVVCLNGTCAENARCDGIYQCSHGEDEHWCLTSESFGDHMTYRYSKLLITIENTRTVNARTFPVPTIQHTGKERNVVSSEHIQSEQLLFDSSHSYQQIQTSSSEEIHPKFIYTCYRGVPLYEPSQDKISCACPPTYYGHKCQYFSDRISIITHLDLTTFPRSVATSLIRVVVHLDFLNTVIDHHIFHVHPSLTIDHSRRYRFFLLYSRSNDFLEHKRQRYFNRTDIINHHLYSVHFDIYSLTHNQTIELGSFHHPIYFDFLPVFRLATVLKFPSWFTNDTLSPCASNPCNANSTCKPILNRNRSYYCSCKSGYSGINCENYHFECLSYCNSKSICRPKFRGLIGSPDRPLCICPLEHMGPRCYLRNEACKSNPCGSNSTCYPSYDLSNEYPVICICPKEFYGNRCQYEKLKIEIRINMTAVVTVSNVQFYCHLCGSNAMMLYHQQIMRGLPNIVHYYHGDGDIPPMGILKIYQELLDPKYFMLYIQAANQSINLTTTPEECPFVLNILSQSNIRYLNRLSKIKRTFPFYR